MEELLDFRKFIKACDPTRSLVMTNPEERQYYIDFSEVRGEQTIETLKWTIEQKDQSSCQLFTGHIGCGKSTELRRLEEELTQEDYHVVYFESDQYLEMVDVDITDILLVIVRQVIESLEKKGIKIKPTYFEKLFGEVADLLQTPIKLQMQTEFSVPLFLSKVTLQTKESPTERSKLRQALEPQTSNILDSLNKEVLGRATEELKKRGKQGLVVIVDNLDRVDNRRMNNSDKTQPEYLFVDRGEQLSKLNCHVVYTIPLVLVFSKGSSVLAQRFGLPPTRLPMISSRLQDGSHCHEGIGLLKQMIMTRAFPEVEPEQRLKLGLVTQVFDSPETLDRLCSISGGHVRNLLSMLYSSFRGVKPPLSLARLEKNIRNYRDSLVLGIKESEWQLLQRVAQEHSVSGEEADFKVRLVILAAKHNHTPPTQILAEFIATLHSLEVSIQLKIFCARYSPISLCLMPVRAAY